MGAGSGTTTFSNFVHLTNYSINKKSQNFVQPSDDLARDDVGYKWSLSAFCMHLEQIEVDMELFWARIYDVILKSFITCEGQIHAATKASCIHRTNCFELFGYDIMIDSDLKPWLIEINMSPSLASDSQLDHQIKATLVTDALNLVGCHAFDRAELTSAKAQNRIRSYRTKSASNQNAVLRRSQ